jgi:two-component system KDP operon response regulator KdpE
MAMATEPLVLAADDEAGILKLIKLELSTQGFRVVTAEDGETALRLLDEHRPEIVLLDIIMPDMDGITVMQTIKDRRNVPVILLTAKGNDSDKVQGLEAGADDYLAKPFSPDELTARVRAVLRRSLGSTRPGHIVNAFDVEINLQTREVKRRGEPVNLTRTEWKLLQYLAANPGKIMLNAELLTKVWGPEFRGDLQYLRVWVSRLRAKLEDNPSEPKMLKTFTGIGYMFETGEEPGDTASSDSPAPVAAVAPPTPEPISA